MTIIDKFIEQHSLNETAKVTEFSAMGVTGLTVCFDNKMEFTIIQGEEDTIITSSGDAEGYPIEAYDNILDLCRKKKMNLS